MNTLTFAEFTETVAFKIRDYLPETFEVEDIETKEIVKTYCSYTGLIVKRIGKNASHIVDLNDAYNLYQEDGFERTMKFIANVVQQDKHFDVSKFSDYSYVKHNLFISLCRFDAEYLKDKVYTMLDDTDLAIIYRLSVDDDGSAVVTESILNEWNVTREQFIEDATANSEVLFPPTIMSLQNQLFAILAGKDKGGDFFTSLKCIDEDDDQAVLTTSNNFLGASAICYEGVLEAIANHFEDSLYILPSSVHEVIIMPSAHVHDVNELKDMVKSVNDTELAPKDLLSYNVYHYNHEAKRITIA